METIKNLSVTDLAPQLHAQMAFQADSRRQQAMPLGHSVPFQHSAISGLNQRLIYAACGSAKAHAIIFHDHCQKLAHLSVRSMSRYGLADAAQSCLSCHFIAVHQAACLNALKSTDLLDHHL